MLETLQASQCSHESREYIGTDATAHFYRCEACGTVIVIQGGVVWQIGPAPPPA